MTKLFIADVNHVFDDEASHKLYGTSPGISP